MNKTKGVELMFFCDCGAAVFYSGAPITAKTVSCPLCRKNFTVNLGITDPALPPKPEPVTPSRELDWVEQLPTAWRLAPVVSQGFDLGG